MNTTRPSSRRPTWPSRISGAGLYHTMGEKAHALADLERAIERDPRFASALSSAVRLPRKR